ncbi:M24 family metallopeptidase [Paraburkholderia flava]|uniref:M24 family metallopeptidase n=1 Tax=Paraburkholderia flava TaxID=2547393 RepID=UPI00105F4621|nr:M24 family metallopeptidase [Paraburkholderia flava]
MNEVAQEAVGQRFSLDTMKYARTMTWKAVDAIAERIKPGMLESEANAVGKEVLAGIGMERIWHPVLVRFGENTLRTFKERSTSDPVLAANDIFFIDIGVVWDGHEGDAGTTYVVGDDAEMHACAKACKTVFDEVEHHWRTTGAGGKALYDYAAARAEAAGWRLNVDIKGHRVSDFPHAIHKAGKLGDYDSRPAEGLWILEIQIAHRERPFGAFYEDLLV